MEWIALVALLLIIFNFSFTQVSNNCNSRVTCNECIQELGCVWCISPNDNSLAQCKEETEILDSWCPLEKIVNPKQNMEIIRNLDLVSHKGPYKEAVVIKPQSIKLELRKGEEYVLPFQYAQAENYPVDLYYIMDLSASMEPHRKKLGELGGKIAEAMRKITSNFRVGFGSFVDKVALPFVSTVPAKLLSPCSLNGVDCVSPYSFKNHMSLTENDSAFSAEVKKARVSGNLDSPEGGFDALMQAIVCKEEIGWRPQARHLIVFSTDALFHIAGDGRLAGVVEPNDAKCHMENNSYTHGLVYDYPSISHINYVAKENNINIIFAVADFVGVYQNLEKQIENSVSGLLQHNSENVVKLIEENCQRIVNTVVMTDDSGSDVEIKYSSSCPKQIANGCQEVPVKQVVNFTATIKPLKCSSTTKIIKIKPEAVDEYLTVQLKVLCDCDCNSPSSVFYKPHAEECSNQGNLQCGVCSCKEGRFGRNCECGSQVPVSNNQTVCKKNPDDAEVCSGLGVCKCGECVCNTRVLPQKIYGKHCECDNYSCKRFGGDLCSSRGVCDCGKCNCDAGWTGDACECPDSNATCIAPGGDGSICSNRGTCRCGECKCNLDGQRFSGKYCEECPTCPGQRCEELRHCVECQAYKSGRYNEDECKSNCTDFATILQERIKENENGKICRTPDEFGCTVVFQYSYDENKNLVVQAQKKKICPEPPNVLAWVSGVIGSIILVGIVTLLVWKILTTIHDKREYEKFENERKNAKWQNNENPLYRPCTTTFNNPLAE